MTWEDEIMLTGKRVTVIGSGKSGISAAKLLLRHQAVVTIYDSKEETDQERVRNLLAAECRIVCGAWTEELTTTTELVIISPGVPTDLPFLLALKEQGIPIWGEIELAYVCSRGKRVGITGTNGKTTTTALTGEILRQYYPEVFVVGNIGIPYTDKADETTDSSVTVAELSSFQLETIHTFCPDVSMILNITPDHLNRHHTMENYIGAKWNVTKNQTKQQVCVLNYEDPILRERAGGLSAAVVWFSSRRRLEQGIFLEQGKILYRKEGVETEILGTDELHIIGLHNYENAMAAIAAAVALGVPLSAIRAGLRSFRAVEHRIEYVATKKGVDYYNDSKGTNPDAAIKGIQAMNKPTLLIGGGYDKGSEYDEWIESFDGKVKHLVLIGQTKEKIAEAAKRHKMPSVICLETFREAMEFCEKHAAPGDAVLLSPACASWGMFSDYEERGRRFKEYVHQIQE